MTREQKRAMWRRSSQKWRDSHPEHNRAMKKAWREKNREKVRLMGRVRDERELLAPGEHSEAQWQLKLLEFDGKCAYCFAVGDMQRDHLVPLSDGGSNSIGNIVPACSTCNQSKNAKSGAELLRWIRATAGRAA